MRRDLHRRDIVFNVFKGVLSIPFFLELVAALDIHHYYSRVVSNPVTEFEKLKAEPLLAAAVEFNARRNFINRISRLVYFKGPCLFGFP